LPGARAPQKRAEVNATPPTLIWHTVVLPDIFEREVLPRLDSTTASTVSPLQLPPPMPNPVSVCTLYRAR